MTISEKARQLRKSPDYKKWREIILKKDNYKCILCGSNEKIEVDHIKPFALFPQLALDISNGRILCHKCHKKTDTYGQLSKYKGNEPIHPILAGDLFYKIKTLPDCIEINNKIYGLTIKFSPTIKKWQSGYEIKKIKLMVIGETVDKSIDNLYQILKKSSSYNFNQTLPLLEKNIMERQTSKILRANLYKFIEKMLNRKLTNEEKQEIASIYQKSIRLYFENTFLNE